MCVPLPVYIFPKVAYSQQIHIHVLPQWDYLITLEQWAHDHMKNGVCTLRIIAFVGSTHFLMVNHHKVNMKMDYMTGQTDHDSFIICSHTRTVKWRELRSLLLCVESLSSEGISVGIVVLDTMLNNLCMLNVLSHQSNWQFQFIFRLFYLYIWLTRQRLRLFYLGMLPPRAQRRNCSVSVNLNGKSLNWYN